MLTIPGQGDEQMFQFSEKKPLHTMWGMTSCSSMSADCPCEVKTKTVSLDRANETIPSRLEFVS